MRHARLPKVGKMANGHTVALGINILEQETKLNKSDVAWLELADKQIDHARITLEMYKTRIRFLYDKYPRTERKKRLTVTSETQNYGVQMKVIEDNPVLRPTSNL